MSLLLWKLCGQTSRIVHSILPVKYVCNYILYEIQRQIHFSGTMMADTDIYSSSMSHLSQAFPKQRRSCFVRKENWLSPLHFSCDAVSRFLDFLLTVLGVIEAQHLFATSFIFSELFRRGSGF